MPRRVWVALVFISTLFAISCHPSPAGTCPPPALEFGNLSFIVRPSTSHAQVVVDIILSGKNLFHQILTIDQSERSFDIQNSHAKASGSVSLQIHQSPSFSTVDVVFSLQEDSREPSAYRGTIFSWVWSDNLIFSESTFNISSEISATTSVRGFNRNFATVVLRAGVLELGQFALTPSAPTAIAEQDLIIGSAKVFKGTKFTLTPPGPDSSGQVFMTGQFQSSNTPTTPISSAIATWPSSPNIIDTETTE